MMINISLVAAMVMAVASATSPMQRQRPGVTVAASFATPPAGPTTAAGPRLFRPCRAGSSTAAARTPLAYRELAFIRRAMRPTITLRCPRMLGFFGGGKDDSVGEGELAIFNNLATTELSDVKFDSLSILIEEWSKLFEGDGASKRTGLTTPVVVVPAPPVVEENVAASSGVRLLFRKTIAKSAYRSKEEEDGEREKPKEEKMEGGVEVTAEKMEDGTVRVRASRCDMDEDTMIKEMSEEAIVGYLKKQIDAWKKEQN